MSRRSRKPSVGSAVASGIVFDPEIRRAAAQAAPAVARLGFTVGRRMARQEAQRQLAHAEGAFATLSSMLTTAGPQLAELIGLAEPPRRKRRVLPVLGATAAVAAAVVIATDPEQRQKIQRLIVH